MARNPRTNVLRHCERTKFLSRGRLRIYLRIVVQRSAATKDPENARGLQVDSSFLTEVPLSDTFQVIRWTRPVVLPNFPLGPASEDFCFLSMQISFFSTSPSTLFLAQWPSARTGTLHS